jgi:hypothetical protein
MRTTPLFAPLNEVIFGLDRRRTGRVRKILSGWLDKMFSSRGTVELTDIQVTNKSQVFRISSAHESIAILKVHKRKNSYVNERLAYHLLADCPHVPKLIAFEDRLNLLVVQSCNGRPAEQSQEDMARIAYGLGRIHSELSKKCSRLDSFASLDVRSLPSVVGANRLLTDIDSALQLSRLYADTFPNGTIPVILGDLKPDHFLIDGVAQVFDLEAWRAGTFFEIDLIALVNIFPKKLNTRSSWRGILSAYLEARSTRSLTLRRIEEQMALAARSIGYEELVRW